MKSRTTIPELSMMIHVGAMTGRHFAIEATPKDTILDVKLRIYEESNLPPESQILLFGERQLSNDHSTLEQHCIKDGAKLSLVLQMNGGHGPAAKLKPVDKEFMILERLLRGIDGDTAFKLLNLIEDKPDIFDHLFPSDSSSQVSSYGSHSSGSVTDESSMTSVSSAAISRHSSASEKKSSEAIETQNLNDTNNNHSSKTMRRIYPVDQTDEKNESFEDQQRHKKSTYNENEIKAEEVIEEDIRFLDSNEKTMKKINSAASLLRFLDANNKLTMSTPNFRPPSSQSIAFSLHTRSSSITSLELVNLLKKSESVQRIVSRASSGKQRSSLPSLESALQSMTNGDRPLTSMALSKTNQRIDANDIALILPQSRPSTSKKSSIPIMKKNSLHSFHFTGGSSASLIGGLTAKSATKSSSYLEPGEEANSDISPVSCSTLSDCKNNDNNNNDTLLKLKHKSSQSLNAISRNSKTTTKSISQQQYTINCSKKTTGGSAGAVKQQVRSSTRSSSLSNDVEQATSSSSSHLLKKQTSSSSSFGLASSGKGAKKKSSLSRQESSKNQTTMNLSSNTKSYPQNPQHIANMASTGTSTTATNINNTRLGGTPRCEQCKKKLGLATTFSCKCGKQLCAVHRYNDRHSCSFNYKEAGRVQLIKENPVVRKGKVNKI